jgi:hypothetical protein
VTTVQQTLVVDAARQTTAHTGDKDDGKSARRRETIFGPDVGEDDEPGWTKPDEGIKVGVDVVKGWVEKAKNEEVSVLTRSSCDILHDWPYKASAHVAIRAYMLRPPFKLW